MKSEHHHGSKTGSKIRKEFQDKSKKIKKVFAENSSDEELIRNMAKIGFTYFDDDQD
jgi:hypothetical protein